MNITNNARQARVELRDVKRAVLRAVEPLKRAWAALPRASRVVCCVMSTHVTIARTRS
jgi:hypothetical protein